MSLATDINGTLNFAAETEKSVAFASALADTSYRVHLSSDVFVGLRITSKTTTGFTVQAASKITGSVGYDVLV